jgi:hypothetical protein
MWIEHFHFVFPDLFWRLAPLPRTLRRLVKGRRGGRCAAAETDIE